jgi:hypothetical protein
MDKFIEILAILGAYFAILLVLSVAVETILEPITPWFKVLRKKLSPEQAMKDISNWLPEGAEPSIKAQAILSFAEDFNVTREEIDQKVKALIKDATTSASALGIPVIEAQARISVGLSEIRKRWDRSEQRRITILRLLSALVGIGVAILIQIDSFQLLSGLIPASALASVDANQLHIGGMIITGLAASAGSSFWHDQLAKVRSLKETAQSAENLASELQRGNS